MRFRLQLCSAGEGLDDHAIADPHVLVQDGALDVAVGTNAHGHILEFAVVVIGAHEDAVLHEAADADAATNTDDGVHHLRLLDHTAFGDQRLFQPTVGHDGTGQEARVRVDGTARIVEVEGRVRHRQFHVRVVEGPDRADVPPVAAEVVAVDRARVDGVGDHIAAEVVEVRMLGQQIDERPRAKQVDAHGSNEGEGRIVPAHQIHQHRRIRGLFLKVHDASIIGPLQYAEARSILLGHRLHGDRDIRARRHVLIQHGRVVHAIQMIAGEDQDMARSRGLDLEELLAHRVRRAFVPALAIGRLLGREDLHITRVEGVELVRRRDMAMQGDGVVLRQQMHAEDSGIDAVADGDIDQAILARDGHGGLGTHFRERVQTGAAPSAEDDRQNVVDGLHGFSLVSAT